MDFFFRVLSLYIKNITCFTSSGKSIGNGTAGNNFKFEKIIKESQPNYSADKATFIVESENNSFTLNTEKRFYPSSNQVMSEAGIRPTLIKDYYVTLGEELDTDIWSFRIQIKTLVRWIWFGALLVTIGTFISSRRNFRNRDE